MTTIHRPAHGIFLRGDTQTRDGGRGVLATRPVVPHELRPFRAGLDGPGDGAVSLRALKDVMASGDEPGTADVPAAPAVRRGVVSRYALFGRLFEAERVVQISAPAGSGKTVLMRSWIAEAGLAQHAAWVTVDSQERDPRRFWISVADALRGTAAGSALVRPLTAAPGLDGWAVVERLLKDLAPLEDRLWLVIDDAHLLDAGEVLPQLELFGVARAAGASVRPRHPARSAAGAAPAAAGGGADRDPCGRSAVQPGRGAGAVRRYRGGVAGGGAGPVARTDRGLGGRAAAGRAIAGRAPGPGAVRRGVLRHRSDGSRVPGGRGAGPAERGGAAAAAAHVPAGAGVRPAGGRADRQLGRGTDPAGSGAGRRVRGLAGRGQVVVPLPPAVRGPAAAGVAPHRAE